MAMANLCHAVFPIPNIDPNFSLKRKPKKQRDPLTRFATNLYRRLRIYVGVRC